jgi:hypothetical protein
MVGIVILHNKIYVLWIQGMMIRSHRAIITRIVVVEEENQSHLMAAVLHKRI